VRITIVITHADRRRLGTLVLCSYTRTRERREYLQALEAELERAFAVDPKEVPHDVVTMNSTIEIRDLKTGELETYTLVYPEMADSSRGESRLSLRSGLRFLDAV